MATIARTVERECGRMINLISQEALLNEINHLYNLNYGEQLIDPQAFYKMVECQEVIKKIKKDKEI